MSYINNSSLSLTPSSFFHLLMLAMVGGPLLDKRTIERRKLLLVLGATLLEYNMVKGRRGHGILMPYLQV
jgi:hypothetical protein